MLVVDDHHLIVQLLATALSAEPDLECVGVAHDVATALRKARELRPDVVVMDVRLGDGDGIAAARELLRELTEVRVIVLTAFVDRRLVQRAAEAGVSALAAKDGEITVLLDLVRHSVRGSFTAGDGIPVEQQPADRLEAAGLTAEDAEVLRLLAAGLDEDELARELGVDVRVGHRRVAAVLTRLGVDAPHQAVSAAVARGLLRVGPV